MSRTRKLPSGMTQRGDVYYAAFRGGGRLIRKRLSTDFKAASEKLNDLKARADKAEFSLLDNNFSLADLRKQYDRHCAQTLRPRTVRRYRQCLATILATLPEQAKASAVTIGQISVYRENRLAGTVKAVFSGKRPKKRRDMIPSHRTVNMEVGALSTMLAWGKTHKLIGSNPLADLTLLPEDVKAKERRALSVEEVEAIFEHAAEHLKPVFRMFLTTAIRRDELVEMRFNDVDFESGTVTVRGATAKNHQAREIPLDDQVLATVKALKEAAKNRTPVAGTTERITELQKKNLSKDHVFVTTANTPWRNNLLRAFYRVCKKAGIEGAESRGSVDLHSLRGTVTTLAIDNGASPKAMQTILGHATLAMTMSVYAKASEKSKRAAIGALPFATVSDPKHVVSIPKPAVPKARASSSRKKKTLASTGVA